MRIKVLFVVLTVTNHLTCLAATDETEAIHSILTQLVLDSGVPQKEVEEFCERHIASTRVSQSVEELETNVAEWRAKMFDHVIFRGQAAMWRNVPVEVDWLDELDGGPGYRIRKLRYQVLPGLWVPALLYEPIELSGKVPVVMNVNGHDRNDGKAARYKQLRCINQVKRGMIALNVEWLGMGQLNTEGFGHYRMNQLDLCGTSGIAPFYLALERGLDVLLQHEHADTRRVGVAGLSGGGWQTIFFSSLDRRVTLANPVAGYSGFITRIHNHSDLGDSEQTPCDMAKYADYTSLTAMMAPRATLLTFNIRDDCCFASGHALPPLLNVAEPAFALYGQRDRLETHVNHDPGTHNFERDNREALYRMIGKHFFPGESFDAQEIASDDEVRSKEELFVPLPPDNTDFNQLATHLSADLPRERLPAEPTDTWIAAARQRLAKVVNSCSYSITASELSEINMGDVHGKLWKLQLDRDWTVPAVELTKGTDAPKATTILVADAGRASASETVEHLLKEGERVLAMDPFYIGESGIPSHNFLFALLVGSVGERPVGLQASQLAAVARWSKELHPDESVQLAAIGERMSLAAMVASAIETAAIDRVKLKGSLASLKQVIERNDGINEKPEFFCFGLLEAIDICELAALTAPRELTFSDADDRAIHELSRLRTWYGILGRNFDPLN